MPELRRYDKAIQQILPSLLLDGWRCRMSTREPQAGDLVMLQAAPISNWHLSIYREAGAGEGYGQKHLLESLKTGELCWWENVGLHILNREKIHLGDDLEWSDEQFAFRDKFQKACKKGDFYMARPFIDKFDGDNVILKFRTRFQFDNLITELPPYPWRKATQKGLLAMLREYEAKHLEDRRGGDDERG